MSTILYVSHDLKEHPDDFHTVQEAIDSISKDNKERVTIFLRKGTYEEKLTIDRPFLTLEGEDPNETILTYSHYARQVMEDGSNRGTFRTASVFIDTHDFTAKNLVFENAAGFGRVVGQALALYVDGDRIIFDNCTFLGSQDTLFTGPLPPTAFQKGGFTGPKEFAPRVNGRHYYHNCFIRGDVDFIFGSATAYFENCEIFSQKTDDEPAAANLADQKCYGYVTASSTAEGQEYGYVFESCKLTSNCPKGSVYLGRPWRNFAKTVYLNCELGAHIKEEGWHDWNKTDAHSTILYAEYNSTGEGAKGFLTKKRAPFSKYLTDSDLPHYTKHAVLSGTDNWEAEI